MRVALIIWLLAATAGMTTFVLSALEGNGAGMAVAAASAILDKVRYTVVAMWPLNAQC